MAQQAVVERGDSRWNGHGPNDDFGEAEVFVVGIRWNRGGRRSTG